MFIARKDMTQAIALEYLKYDPITGFLHRRKKYSNNTVAGKRACRKTNNKNQDHLVVKLHGVDYPAHRMIWLMLNGSMPSGHIDHINHNEEDNREVNLRDVSQSANNRNLSKRSTNCSGVTGVWIRKDVSKKAKRYVAEIRDDLGKKKTKAFTSIEAAIEQRKAWEALYGYHANHGK